MTDKPVSLAPARKRGGLMGSSFVFAAVTLVSRLTGMLRDLVLTARVGGAATIAGDAYYTALMFPNLFRRIFAEGAFAAAFVPVYSRRYAEDEKGADQMAADALAGLAAATVVFTILCQLAMTGIMGVMSGDYRETPGKFELTVILTQITMPYLPCMAIAALFSGVLNARGRFFVSGLYPTILNLVMLAIVLPFKDPVEVAYAASIGVIIAGVGQAGLVWWAASKAGARIVLVRPRLNAEVKALIILAGPAALANSVTQLNLFISTILAGDIAGMRVWMNVADRLYQLPLSLVGVAIGIALLPRLSQALQRNDHDDAQASMDQAMVFALAFSLPAAAALLAMPHYLIDALFTRGAFTAADAQATGTLLLHYSWGVPAFVLIRILQPAFFARQDTKTPMRISLISVAVNIVLGVTLFRTIGFYGVAIATSIASWLTVLQMAVILHRREVWRPSPLAASKMLRVAAASLALGVLLALAAHFRPLLEAPFAPLLGAKIGPKEIVIAGLCVAGGLLYPVLLFAFGGVTPAEFKAVLKRKRNDPAPEALP